MSEAASREEDVSCLAAGRTSVPAGKDRCRGILATRCPLCQFTRQLKHRGGQDSRAVCLEMKGGLCQCVIPAEMHARLAVNCLRDTVSAGCILAVGSALSSSPRWTQNSATCCDNGRCGKPSSGTQASFRGHPTCGISWNQPLESCCSPSVFRLPRREVRRGQT